MSDRRLHMSLLVSSCYPYLFWYLFRKMFKTENGFKKFKDPYFFPKRRLPQKPRLLAPQGLWQSNFSDPPNFFRIYLELKNRSCASARARTGDLCVISTTRYQLRHARHCTSSGFFNISNFWLNFSHTRTALMPPMPQLQLQQSRECSNAMILYCARRS